MVCAYRCMILAILLAFAAGTAPAQVTTGTPPFGSFAGGPDLIDLANLNSNLVTPVFSKAGRGIPFSYNLVYNASVWNPSGGGWQPTTNWGWSSTQQAPIGTISYFGEPVPCEQDGQQDFLYYYFWYADPYGVTHAFYLGNQPLHLDPNCGIDSVTAVATEGSGLTITAKSTYYANPITVNIKTKSGELIVPIILGQIPVVPTITDRNGNQITLNTGGVFTDTLGTTALEVSGSAPSPVKLTYTAPNLAAVAVQLNYTTYTVNTNFGISGIAEYGRTAVPVITSIGLPDGSQFSFTYEHTPTIPSTGACTPLGGTYSGYCVTARLASVTLPTGGTINYSYSGGNNGIFSDGSAATLTRQTPDGTWIYAQVKGTGAASTTTVTDPQGNATVIQFQGIYEAERQAYQGSSSTGTLLQTTNTCYNGSTSPCTATAVTLPITRRTQVIQLPNSAGKQCEHDILYNSYGLVTEVDNYDYGSGGIGLPIEKTLTTYASLGNGIVDRPSSVIVEDAGSVTKAQTTYAYDETSVVATSGTPQHVSVTGARGNATTVKNYTNTTAFLTSKATYFDTGKVQTATAVNGAQTTYTYGACGNSFPTSVSEPLTLSVSETWNCAGAVLTSFTDENGKQTTVAYTDAYFWRPASSTDATGAVSTLTYNGQNSVESTLPFNAGNSAVDVLKTLDSLGRVRVQQTRQSPGSSSFDSGEQDFDSLGRPDRTTLSYSGTASQLNSTAPATTETYDALNRVMSATDAGGGNTTYSYNQNDVLATVGPAPAGENTKSRQLESDGLGRLTSVCEITSATGSGICGQNVSKTGFWTQYTYDALGDLTGITQNAQAASGSQQKRSYTYDFLGRLTSETNPEIGPASAPAPINYTYDSATGCAGTSSGDLVQKVDPQGDTVCFAYDAWHRNTSTTYTGSYASVTPNKYFVYDSATVNSVAMVNAKARLAEAYTATTQSGTKITDEGFSYSVRGEAVGSYQLTPHSSPSYYQVSQTYWPHGAPNTLTSNIATLPTVTYGGTIGSTVGLDGEGRVTQVTSSSGQNPVTGVSYNLYGSPPKLTVTFGSGDSDIYTYDANTNRMIGYQFNIGISGLSDSGALTWNANSTLQKLAIVDGFNSADNQTCIYGYDDILRLTSANCGSAANQTFSFDPFGNIDKSGSPYTFQPIYTPSRNRISSVGGVSATYDSNGNVIYDGVHNYTWDADGNSITMDAVGTTFDALDRMVEQNRSGSYTEIIYSPTGSKLALMNGQTLEKAFIPLPGKATAVYTTAGLNSYSHSDWLGSARLTSSPTRTALSTTAYAPFGETYAQSGTANPSFTGQNSDTASGDYDFLYREYSTQGRWPSPDPARTTAVNPMAPQSWNRYAYVRNNPVSLVDPVGLDCIYANEDGSATIVTGDCIDGQAGFQNGVFVDGTIDTKSTFTRDLSTGDLIFGLSTENGGYGTGVALSLYDPQNSDSYQNSLMPALSQTYNLAIGPMNVMSVAFRVEMGGIIAIEAAPAVPVIIANAQSASAAATVSAEIYVGWQNIYQFTSGMVNTVPPSTIPGMLGGLARVGVKNLLGVK